MFHSLKTVKYNSAQMLSQTKNFSGRGESQTIAILVTSLSIFVSVRYKMQKTLSTDIEVVSQ